MKRFLFLVVFLVLPVGLLQFCSVQRQVTKGNLPQMLEADESIVDSLFWRYYSAALELTGSELKRELHRTIRNHKVFSYDELWEILPITDADPDNPGHIVLLYSSRSQDKTQRDRGTRFDYKGNGYTLVDSWNREHVWPKSHGFPNRSDTAYSDLHHLRPADRSVNSARNTRSFDLGEEVYFDNNGTVETGNLTSREKWIWEPASDVKGDIARMLFYMAVRYEGPAYDLELVDGIVPRQNRKPIMGKLSTLLAWHRMDPVDDRERNRNELIYELYQGNRNPFIDNPDWVEAIWGE